MIMLTKNAETMISAFCFKFGKKTTTTKKDKQTTTIHLTEPCIKCQTHSSGGSRVRARPPSPSPPPSPAPSPYLHLEALKVQNSLSDNYQLPPPLPPKKLQVETRLELTHLPLPCYFLS